MKELVEEVFETKARIGMPNNQEGIPSNFLRTGFAVPIGMLKCIENMNHHRRNLLEDKKGFLKSTYQMLKHVQKCSPIFFFRPKNNLLGIV